MYVEAHRAESAREEAEEKIRGSRNPAWGRVGEGGSVGNHRGQRGSEDEKRVHIYFYLMESVK